MPLPWCENRKGRNLSLVYRRVTAPVYRAGLKSPPILDTAAPTTKLGDIALTDSPAGVCCTDANEQS